jgi:hypothetical protein
MELKKISNDQFSAVFTKDGLRINFVVYQIVLDTEGGIYYVSDECGDFTETIDNDSRIVMKGSYCWRGVWEGRLYFPDCEYWGAELSEMSIFYDNFIVPACKKQIRKDSDREIND